MPSSVIELYDKLRTAPDDETRARVIAEAFEALEERYPHLGDMATRANLRETELRLTKEIEQVRADLKVEIEQVRTDLTKEIEQVRAELKVEIEQVRTDLTKEIEQVRAELKVEIERVHADLKVQIEQVRTEVEKVRAEMKETELHLVREIERTRSELKVEIARSHTAWLKWSFLFWLSQFAALMLLLWRIWPQN